MRIKPTNATHTYVVGTFTSLLFQLAVFTLGWFAVYACKKVPSVSVSQLRVSRTVPAFTGHLVSRKRGELSQVPQTPLLLLCYC